MRGYQQRAAQSIQTAVKAGATRFLFEMATGTGKTLTAAAVIKLFLRSGNARRVLFLVDRLELEDQASKAFIFLLKNDYKPAFTKKVAMTGARQKSSSRPCKACCTTTNTRSYLHPPILIW